MLIKMESSASGGGEQTTEEMKSAFEGSQYAPQYVCLYVKGFNTLEIRTYYESADRTLTIYTANDTSNFVKNNETLLGTCMSTTPVSIDISGNDYIYIAREQTSSGSSLYWWYKLVV